MTTPDTLCPACGQDNAPDGPGCACYGVAACGRCGAPCPDGIQPNGIGPCCWPSWHPTSADLAAFRAYLLAPSLRATGSPVPDPPADTPRRWRLSDRDDDGTRHLTPTTDPLARPVSGAWQSELREGIGHRATARDCSAVRCSSSAARREAAAMRSRAYPDALIDPDDFAAFGFLTPR